MKTSTFLVIATLGVCCTAGAQYVERLKQVCASYGFHEGTDAHAQCVQRLDAEVQRRQMQQASDQCGQLRDAMRESCNSPLFRTAPEVAAFYCGQAQGNYQRYCSR